MGMKRSIWGGLALLVVIGLTACAPAKVADKKYVSIDYTGTFADGTVFSKSEEGKPLEFMMGAGTLIPTLESGLMGLKVGDTKKIDIKAADAYGEYTDAKVQVVPKDQFPEDLKLEVGQRYQMQTGSGAIVMMVKEIKAKEVIVDFNHPLAGKDLVFDVKVVKIRDATKEELLKSQQDQQTATPTVE
jgi:peptidylprolyl isomerase